MDRRNFFIFVLFFLQSSLFSAAGEGGLGFDLIDNEEDLVKGGSLNGEILSSEALKNELRVLKEQGEGGFHAKKKSLKHKIDQFIDEKRIVQGSLKIAQGGEALFRGNVAILQKLMRSLMTVRWYTIAEECSRILTIK